MIYFLAVFHSFLEKDAHFYKVLSILKNRATCLQSSMCLGSEWNLALPAEKCIYFNR